MRKVLIEAAEVAAVKGEVVEAIKVVEVLDLTQEDMQIRNHDSRRRKLMLREKRPKKRVKSRVIREGTTKAKK